MHTHMKTMLLSGFLSRVPALLFNRFLTDCLIIIMYLSENLKTALQLHVIKYPHMEMDKVN